MPKYHSDRKKIKRLIIGVGIIFLCFSTYIYPKFLKRQPPKKEDLPLLSPNLESSFLDAEWKAANIEKICIFGNIHWPANQQYPLPSYKALSKIVNQLGYDAIQGNSEDCDAFLNLQISGKPLSAQYSGAITKTCLTGYDFTAQINLTSQGLPDLVFNQSEVESPPESLVETNCETAYQVKLYYTWITFLNTTFKSVWGEKALISIEQTYTFIDPRHDVCVQGLSDAKNELLTIYIVKMMENEEYPNTTCLKSIKKLGPDAKDAIPYLLYLLDTINTDSSYVDDQYKEEIFETLRSITAEDIGDSSWKWWGWWEGQQKEN